MEIACRRRTAKLFIDNNYIDRYLMIVLYYVTLLNKVSSFSSNTTPYSKSLLIAGQEYTMFLHSIESKRQVSIIVVILAAIRFTAIRVSGKRWRHHRGG